MSKNEAYEYAMLLLSQRDHSEKELAEKLSRKSLEATHIAEALAYLKECNYLNDLRFAQTYIRSKAARLYGQFRIRQELRIKGVSDEEVALAFEEETVDWFENARSLRLRKFGPSLPSDFKDKSKQMRYLQSHGFSFDEIHYAFEPDDE